MKPFDGDVIVVSGASSDVGRLCVDRLLKAGARLYLIDPDSAALAELLNGYKAHGRLTASCSMLGSPAACEDALSMLAQPIHAVLHFAGARSARNPLQWDSELASDLAEGLDLVQACAPRLDAARTSRIVFVSRPFAGEQGGRSIASSAAKGGWAELVGSLAARLHPNALVNGISPGGVPANVQGRPRPEEIADVVEFLLGQSSGCITGQVLNCDAGRALQLAGESRAMTIADSFN